MNRLQRTRTALTFASYALVAVVICIALSWLSARITAAHLLNEAQEQLTRIETDQPIWQWKLRKPRDLVARRAFGNAKVMRDDDALSITSIDGTPFELGLPVAWSLDLAHWPILQLQLRSSAQGTLGLVWRGDNPSTCVASKVATLTADTRILRIDLRGLALPTGDEGTCPLPGVVRMFRLRIQIPASAAVRLSSAVLLTTEPVPSLRDVAIDLPESATKSTIDQLNDRARGWPIPLFRLMPRASAETMLSTRDQLRDRWPAALVVPAGATPHVTPSTPPQTVAKWIACAVYLLGLVWLTLRPGAGRLRPWLEIAGCLLGPLWLVAGLNWGLYATPLGVTAFAGGLLFALIIERRHLSRLWRLPTSGSAWLWPLAPLSLLLVLMAIYGHSLHPLPLAHVFAYLAWAWLQQWLMLVVLLRRFEQIVRRTAWVILAVAITFALLHTPNGLLMQLCFVGELWWAYCFLRSRSVLAIGLAHAVCALLVEAGLVGGLVRSLEVSARFFL